MYRFLLLYFGVYGGMCAYACRRFQLGLGLTWRSGWPVTILFALLLVSPILAHRLRSGATADLCRTVSYIAFVGMAWVFWWTCTFLVIDAWNLATRLVPTVSANWGVTPVRALQAALVLTALGSLWGLVEARLVRVREVAISTPALPAAGPPVRILAISDLHLGPTSSPALIAEIAGKAERACPDLLLSLGDFLDSTQPFVTSQLQPFRMLEPALGKYAVLGNHEAYAGAGRALDLLEQTGFRVLRQERAAPLAGIELVGVDDPAVQAVAPLAMPTEADLLSCSGRDQAFTVLLKHQPWVSAAARDGADLQLSGHTHNGQIFPFGWIVRLFHPYSHGRLLRLGGAMALYVSPGTGTWGPPFRVLARSELTLFVLRGQGQGKPTGRWQPGHQADVRGMQGTENGQPYNAHRSRP